MEALLIERHRLSTEHASLIINRECLLNADGYLECQKRLAQLRARMMCIEPQIQALVDSLLYAESTAEQSSFDMLAYVPTEQDAAGGGD